MSGFIVFPKPQIVKGSSENTVFCQFKYFNTKIVAYVNITLDLTSSIYIRYKNYDFELNYRSLNSKKGRIRHHSKAFAIHNIPNANRHTTHDHSR